ncbi:OPT family small oligopeptide transporter [Exophiala oligosperma]|uniref:OPT family small oligopeptide transporter n=1 Tax=Exophiala oligosperma TaxID=215243 RepID=A0A0D2E4D4_9EURO|nr:OPT family small oligopeptide transporter [Exophiala oligosperma]KIW42659.1 OPT family small oligopeptide transporter [Exophiala oligosperma]
MSSHPEILSQGNHLHDNDERKAKETSGNMIDEVDAAATVIDVPLPPETSGHIPAEVLCSIPADDDPSIPCNTVRMWVLTTVFVIVFGAVNMFFSLRFPMIVVTSIVAQLVTHPLGLLWDQVVPDWRIGLGGSWHFNLNPSPWNKKEHALVTIVVSLVGSHAYVTNILVAQAKWYGQSLSYGYIFLTILSTQSVGYGIAGLTRRWVVDPSYITWPQTLANAVLFQTLHRERGPGDFVSGWTISRYRFFFYAFLASFAWFWLPGYLFTALSTFTWICWIRPDNVVVNQLFGYKQGLGMIPITFDWSQITTYNLSPLLTPWYVEANTMGSVVFFFWLILPILYYTNTWFGKYMPMLSSNVFDNTGSSYNVTRVLTSNFQLDEAAYKEYSPLYMPIAYTIFFGLSFAAVTAMFVHTALWHGKDIYRRFKDPQYGAAPGYLRQVRENYAQTPDWWYLCIGVAFFLMGILTTSLYDTRLPWWGFIVAVSLGTATFLPQGIIMGITNQHVALNTITEFVSGYMLPGRPIAMMMVKVFGDMLTSQGLHFSRDLKLGQYMRIPPRTLFWAQTYGTVLSAIVQGGVLRWMLTSIHDLCEEDQGFGLTCPSARVQFSSSIIFGVIGPQRLFSRGHLYHPVLYFFLVGALLPIPVYLMANKYPSSYWRLVHVPIMFTGPVNIPPATGLNYASWALVGYLFNGVIKRRALGWYLKYNYVLSAGLDVGVALAGLVIFFCLDLPGATLDWWGNNVYKRTADAKGTPFFTLADGQTFGFKVW